MSDNKHQKAARDRNQVAVGESYEVDYIATELGVSRHEVEAAIEKVGNSREEISKYLKNNKK
ncbi:hypothetical protein BWD42_02235 [Sphingobacterium sp. CZ-UAM]|uniref:DUF3606 domain-containing protein n=1 Tax=Sphingobacterium sp. CZ-UAM TaxID=1933868 RepID=UPI000986C5E6|nr:DUF3606 domain-containing protein [Sphingobacterium sp. CZ-UAM]OOG18801.1 hypothetical protein BWD42_02235 [Sphingobacterium sp. CZ-UAM]